MQDIVWEDSLLERRVESDLKDLLKTFVAFSNSVRPGHTAVVLIGEKDDGSVQGVKNPDNIQKRVREICDKIYPPILWRSSVYEKDHHSCVRVEIEYDGETPHFGGVSWVRKGAVTQKASEEVFQKLIEFRLSKTRELAKWIGKEITVEPDLGEIIKKAQGRSDKIIPRLPNGPHNATLKDVNGFWVTFEFNDKRHSEPLDKIYLSWDDANNHLKIWVNPNIALVWDGEDHAAPQLIVLQS
jgi:predicted HTH transcriptional regulator